MQLDADDILAAVKELDPLVFERAVNRVQIAVLTAENQRLRAELEQVRSFQRSGDTAQMSTFDERGGRHG